MKVANVRIHQSPDMVIGDLFFAVGNNPVRLGTRLDQYFNDFLECLNRLDRDGLYTFHDPKSRSYVRFVRNGEEVLVSSDEATPLPDGPKKVNYAQFRASILARLHRYGDQLAEVGPAHPETRQFQTRLAGVEAG